MNILVGKRQEGKTTHLIKMSADGYGTIVTFSEPITLKREPKK